MTLYHLEIIPRYTELEVLLKMLSTVLWGPTLGWNRDISDMVVPIKLYLFNLPIFPLHYYSGQICWHPTSKLIV